MLNITEIKVNPLRTDGKVRAFADIVVDGCLKIKGIAIIRGDDGCHFTSMPKREKRDGERIDVVHPIDNETRIQMENKILDEYEAELNRRAGNIPA